MKILIIVPAFNEEENVLSALHDIKNHASYCDVVVINDASIDKTSEKCKAYGVNVINLSNNLGIGGAMQTGYIYARNNDYDYAIQFDGDGQHPARYIKNLLEAAHEKKADLVIGSRYLEKEGYQSTKIRQMGIKYFSWLIKFLTSREITDPTSGFRVANKKVINLFAKSYPQDFPEPETVVLLAKNNYKIKEVSVKMNERKGGKSSISFSKSIYYMVKVTLGILFV